MVTNRRPREPARIRAVSRIDADWNPHDPATRTDEPNLARLRDDVAGHRVALRNRRPMCTRAVDGTNCMTLETDRARIWLLWVVLGAVAVFGLNIGGRCYETEGVTRYAVMVLEMRHTGSMVPTVNGEPYHEAMPLAAWLPLFTSSLFGEVSPFTIRLHSTLASLATVAATMLLVWRTSPRVALLAGMGVVLSYLSFSYGQNSRIDAFLGLAVTAGIGAFYAAGRSIGRARFLGFGLSGLATALAVAAKGPYALAIVGAALGPFLLLERRWRDIRDGGLIVGGLTIGLTAAWLLPYVHYLGPTGSKTLINQFFWLETVDKFQHGYGKSAPFYSYVWEVTAKLAPWSLLAIPAIFGVLRRPKSASSLERLCTSWVLVPLILLSLASGKHIRYFVPIMPAFAILAVFQIDRWLTAGRPFARRAFLGFSLGFGSLLALAGVGAIVAFLVIAGFNAWAVFTGLGASMAGVAAIVLARRQRTVSSLVSVYVGLAAMIGLYFASVCPLPEMAEISCEYHRLATRLRPRLRPGDTLGLIAPAATEARVIAFSELALHLDNRWVPEYPRNAVPDSVVLLVQEPMDGRAVRATIAWPRSRREPPETWLLLEPAGRGSSRSPK
jgi:4-amino-4-deoxy-L-arabinose transferase-like glycosyltransferase